MVVFFLFDCWQKHNNRLSHEAASEAAYKVPHESFSTCTNIKTAVRQCTLFYADLNGADSIIAYPGPEPYCPTEWKPMDVQTAWYEAQGFKIDHRINGVVPCMIKDLAHEVAL